jgi:hypothetical protein
VDNRARQKTHVDNQFIIKLLRADVRCSRVSYAGRARYGIEVAIEVNRRIEMNRIITVLSAIVLLLISCGEKEKIVEVPVATNCPPSAPRGVYSINLDGYVRIVWYPNPEDDVAGYDVYRGQSLYGDYNYIGTVQRVKPDPYEYFFDDTQTDNGIQHFYAVVAFDGGGLESDLSYEEVSGTPRPEGVISLFDRCHDPSISGYDLSSLSNTQQSYDAPTTDIYFDVCGGPAYIVTCCLDVGIQDYGYVGDNFDGINYAPTQGWSPTGAAEAIAKHCYILRLLEGDGFHYAKLYVSEVTSGFVTMWWAYQTTPGNRDLAPPAPGRGVGLGTSSYQPDVTPGATIKGKPTEVSATPPIVERVTWTRDSRFEQQTTH